jgi:hypothetical protein
MTDQHDEPPIAQPVLMDYASPPRSLPKGMAVAAMVLGIIGLLSPFGLIFIGLAFGALFISLPCSILAIIFGEIANRNAKAGRANGRGMAVAGMITGFVGLFLSVGVCAVCLASVT